MQVTISDSLVAQWIEAKAQHRALAIQWDIAAQKIPDWGQDSPEMRAYQTARKAAIKAHEAVLRVERKLSKALLLMLARKYPR
jgi:hypothetical protein